MTSEYSYHDRNMKSLEFQPSKLELVSLIANWFPNLFSFSNGHFEGIYFVLTDSTIRNIQPIPFSFSHTILNDSKCSRGSKSALANKFGMRRIKCPWGRLDCKTAKLRDMQYPTQPQVQSEVRSMECSLRIVGALVVQLLVKRHRDNSLPLNP